MKIHQHIEHIEHIELEMLNQQPGAQARAPHCTRGTIILGSALVLVSVSVCFFFFFFRPLCVQDMQPLTDDGKVTATCRFQDTERKRLWEIFQAEKSGKYLIHGWLKRNATTNETVNLVHTLNGQVRTLQKTCCSGLMFFGTEVLLYKNSRVHLQFNTQLDTDGFFYIYKLCPHLDTAVNDDTTLRLP